MNFLSLLAQRKEAKEKAFFRRVKLPCFKRRRPPSLAAVKFVGLAVIFLWIQELRRL